MTPEPQPALETSEDLLKLLRANARREEDVFFDAAHHLPCTDAGNAEAFCALYGRWVRYDHARERWLIWNGHRWQPDADGNVHRMALETVRARQALAADDRLSGSQRDEIGKHAIRSEHASRLNALLALARNMLPVADDGKQYDATPGLLGVPNGVVDLRTGDLRDGRPEDRITMATAANYDPGAYATRWEQFVLEICNEDSSSSPREVASYLKRLAGYSLTGEANMALLLFMMGVGGNGKTRLLRILAEVFGDYAYDLPASVLTASGANAHRHYLAELEGKRFVISTELGDELLNADRLKALSGGDGVTADRKYARARGFGQTWQLWLTSNKLPRSADNSIGFWRRVRVAPFVRHFEDEDEPDLLDTLRAEREGILRWAVEGAVEYYALGMREGPKPEAIIEGTQEYRERTDPLSALFEQGYLVKEGGYWTPTKQAHDGYLAYAQAAGIQERFRKSEDGLGKSLSDQYASERREYKLATGGTERRRGFVGVRVGPAAPATTWSLRGDEGAVFGGAADAQPPPVITTTTQPMEVPEGF